MLEHSRFYQMGVGVGQTLSAFVRGSYLYRWLTAEPDPDVIVIDLRETWTVGPIIVVLDRIFGIFERAATDSTIVAVCGRIIDRTLAAPIRMAGAVCLGMAILTALFAIAFDGTRWLIVALGFAVVGGVALFETRSWAELRETRPVELLVAAFEPPEPPDSANSDFAHTADNGEKVKTDTGNPAGDSETSHTNTNADVGDDDTGIERNER